MSAKIHAARQVTSSTRNRKLKRNRQLRALVGYSDCPYCARTVVYSRYRRKFPNPSSTVAIELRCSCCSSSVDTGVPWHYAEDATEEQIQAMRQQVADAKPRLAVKFLKSVAAHQSVATEVWHDEIEGAMAPSDLRRMHNMIKGKGKGKP